jgi:acetolactate decarboxylase
MKKNRNLFYKIILLVFFVTIFSCQGIDKIHNNRSNSNTIVQFSPISFLLDGVFEGDISIGELKKSGNIGLGTFNKLDGEMIALDNEFYRISSTGAVTVVDNAEKSPFAVVSFFHPDYSYSLVQNYDLVKLQNYIESLFPSKNVFYAIKIQGKFSYVKTRSVPIQKRPYKKLIEVVKNQSVFEFNNIEGTLVGYYFPEYTTDINIPGFHLHFISSDKTKGGHLLSCNTENIKIELDSVKHFNMILPSNEEFLKRDFKLKKSELDSIEKK